MRIVYALSVCNHLRNQAKVLCVDGCCGTPGPLAGAGQLAFANSSSTAKPQNLNSDSGRIYVPGLDTMLFCYSLMLASHDNYAFKVNLLFSNYAQFFLVHRQSHFLLY